MGQLALGRGIVEKGIGQTHQKNSATPLLCASALKILNFLGQRMLLNMQAAEAQRNGNAEYF